MKTINTGKLYGYDKRKAMEAEETVMLYSHRVYFKGEAAPIGFNTGLTLVGLVDRHGEDDVLYIEDMLMKPWLDKCIHALKLGVAMGTDGLFITYIGEDTYNVIDPALEHGDDSNDMPETEMDIRRRLQQYYKKNPQAVEEDTPYIEEKVIQYS